MRLGFSEDQACGYMHNDDFAFVLKRLASLRFGFLLVRYVSRIVIFVLDVAHRSDGKRVCVDQAGLMDMVMQNAYDFT